MWPANTNTFPLSRYNHTHGALIQVISNANGDGGTEVIWAAYQPDIWTYFFAHMLVTSSKLWDRTLYNITTRFPQSSISVHEHIVGWHSGIDFKAYYLLDCPYSFRNNKVPVYQNMAVLIHRHTQNMLISAHTCQTCTGCIWSFNPLGQRRPIPTYLYQAWMYTVAILPMDTPLQLWIRDVRRSYPTYHYAYAYCKKVQSPVWLLCGIVI
jgi:hypothetical protein